MTIDRMKMDYENDDEWIMKMDYEDDVINKSSTKADRLKYFG
jgi:hypothetical protein